MYISTSLCLYISLSLSCLLFFISNDVHEINFNDALLYTSQKNKEINKKKNILNNIAVKKRAVSSIFKLHFYL